MLVLFSALATGALAGVMALPHCVAMCGPYAAYACTAGRRAGGVGRARADVRYLGARSVAYGSIGALAGASGGVVGSWLPPTWATIALSSLLALGMLSLAFRLLRAERPKRLVQIGRPRGAATEGPEQAVEAPSTASALQSLLARALSAVSASPALLGALMALFPCGALYAALMVAAATRTAWGGVASMLGFSITSAFALGISGWVARASMALDRQTRLALGAALVVGAVVLVVRPLLSVGAEQTGPACHAPAVEGAR